MGALGSCLGALGCSLGTLGSSLGALGSSLGALGCSLGAPGCSLDAPWELCCVPWGRLGASWELLGFLGALLGWTWGGLSRLASISSALLGVLGVEMLQNVAVAKVKLVFLKKCCCNQQTGGVPLPFVHSGDMKMAFTHETNCF